MADAVYLHVGAPKSGTTYLQSVMFGNRPALEDAGVLIPGGGVGDYSRAAVAMRARRRGKGPAAETWKQMVVQVREWSGTAVVSSEWFCLTPPELVGRAIDELGGDVVRVVFTARALAAAVPAAWQEAIKLGSGESLESFVAGLDDPENRWCWDTLDAARALPRWADVVGPGRVHVVTVPRDRSRPGQLMERFAAVCGFDTSGLDLSAAQGNESLSVEATVLMERLGPAIAEVIDFSDDHWTEPYRWLRRYLSHAVLSQHKGRRIDVGEELFERFSTRSRESAATLEAAGYRIEGELADLTEVTRGDRGTYPPDVTADELLDVAVPAMAQLLADVRSVTLESEGGPVKGRRPRRIPRPVRKWRSR